MPWLSHILLRPSAPQAAQAPVQQQSGLDTSSRWFSGSQRRCSSTSARSGDSSSASASSTGEAPTWPPVARALWHVAPLVAYYCACAAALGVVLWRLSTARYTAQALLVDMAALLLALLLCVCMWPPLQALLPRVEGPQGWRVVLRPLSSKRIGKAPSGLDGSGEPGSRGGCCLQGQAAS